MACPVYEPVYEIVSVAIPSGITASPFDNVTMLHCGLIAAPAKTVTAVICGDLLKAFCPFDVSIETLVL